LIFIGHAGFVVAVFERHPFYNFNTGRRCFMKLTKMMLLALVMVSVFSLAACNTVEGVGKDIKKAGQTIEKAGDKK